MKILLVIMAVAESTDMLVGATVRAETYIAGMVGVHLPDDLSNIQIDDGVTSTNEKLQTSVMYGAKLGHYFDSLRWLGVEAKVFNATPHKKQQDAGRRLGRHYR